MATLRKDTFGREDLIGKREVPDFTHLPLHKVISFFRDAKFKSLSMRPLFEEYLPTTTSEGSVDQELAQMKDAGTKKGNALLSKYLYQM